MSSNLLQTQVTSSNTRKGGTPAYCDAPRGVARQRGGSYSKMWRNRRNTGCARATQKVAKDTNLHAQASRKPFQNPFQKPSRKRQNHAREPFQKPSRMPKHVQKTLLWHTTQERHSGTTDRPTDGRARAKKKVIRVRRGGFCCNRLGCSTIA